MDRGIVLAGGGALLHGLDERLRHETHMPAHLAESPLTCVAVGSGRSLEEFEAIKKHGEGRRAAATATATATGLSPSGRTPGRPQPVVPSQRSCPVTEASGSQRWASSAQRTAPSRTAPAPRASVASSRGSSSCSSRSRSR